MALTVDTYIVLTEEQKDQVLTGTLRPRRIAPNQYILGKEVLADPLQEDHRAILEACPQMQVELPAEDPV